MPLEDNTIRAEATMSLTRVQEFEVDTLPRDEDLGRSKNFREAIAPASRLIELYKRLSPRALDDFPAQQLQQVRSQADSDFNIFQQILSFDADQPTSARDNLVATLANAYNQAFAVLHPLIAYSLHRSADFQRLDADARAALQAIRDQAATITQELGSPRDEARRILTGVREAAALRGTSCRMSTTR